MSAIGSTICTAGFPSAAIASSCFTARCASIWHGFFIATLLFLRKRKLLLAYQGFEREVATFSDLPGIPILGGHFSDFPRSLCPVNLRRWPQRFRQSFNHYPVGSANSPHPKVAPIGSFVSVCDRAC